MTRRELIARLTSFGLIVWCAPLLSRCTHAPLDPTDTARFLSLSQTLNEATDLDAKRAQYFLSKLGEVHGTMRVRAALDEFASQGVSKDSGYQDIYRDTLRYWQLGLIEVTASNSNEQNATLYLGALMWPRFRPTALGIPAGPGWGSNWG